MSVLIAVYFFLLPNGGYLPVVDQLTTESMEDCLRVAEFLQTQNSVRPEWKEYYKDLQVGCFPSPQEINP